MSQAGAVPHLSQRRVLLLIAIGQLLALSLWFSVSAVAPQLSEVWQLSAGQEAALTLASAIGVCSRSIGFGGPQPC